MGKFEKKNLLFFYVARVIEPKIAHFNEAAVFDERDICPSPNEVGIKGDKRLAISLDELLDFQTSKFGVIAKFFDGLAPLFSIS